jgi:hypothetical protein
LEIRRAVGDFFVPGRTAVKLSEAAPLSERGMENGRSHSVTIDWSRIPGLALSVEEVAPILAFWGWGKLTKRG